MTRKFEARHSENIRQGQPTGVSVFQESVPRWAATTDNALAASGVVLSVGVPLQNGDVVTNIVFTTGATAAATPTAGFAALYSPAGVLLAQSADFGSTARAANTEYSAALATPQTITTAGVYYVALSFTAGTVPTAWGAVVGNAVMSAAGTVTTGRRILAQTHGSAVGAVAPATIATGTAVARIPYVVCT